MNGREPSQKRMKETKWTVVVPEFGMPLGMPPDPVPSSFVCQLVVDETRGWMNIYISPVVPDASNHEIYASPSDPRLHSVP